MSFYKNINNFTARMDGKKKSDSREGLISRDSQQSLVTLIKII